MAFLVPSFSCVDGTFRKPCVCEGCFLPGKPQKDGMHLAPVPLAQFNGMGFLRIPLVMVQLKLSVQQWI